MYWHGGHVTRRYQEQSYIPLKHTSSICNLALNGETVSLDCESPMLHAKFQVHQIYGSLEDL